LPDVYSRKTATVVECVQQDDSYFCQIRTAGKQLLLSGVYSRTIATFARCVQQENSYCYQVCTAGKRRLLSDVYSRKTATVVRSFRQPVRLYRCVRPIFHPSAYVFLPICLSVSPSVPFLSYRSNGGY